MQDRKLFRLEVKRGSLIMGLFVTSALLIASLVFVWQVQASPQETINLEFFYSGDVPANVSAAADDFADLLSQETGLTVNTSVHNCEATIVNHLGTGQADVAVLSLYGYVHGNDAYGIQANLVNRLWFDLPYFKSQILVQTTSGYMDIWDLQDTRFAAPNPTSTSGYYVPYITVLNLTGMTPEKFFSEVYFTGSHEQVVRDVYTGDADCGATFVDARDNVVGDYPDVKSVVSVLQESDEIPNNPWAFRSGLSTTLIQKLSGGIVAVAGTPDGDTALKTIFGSNFSGIDPVQDDAYDIIRDIVGEFGLRLDPCIPIFLPAIINSSGD